MDLNLNGRTVVVTGGSKGLGFACAEALLREGAQVALVSRSAENLRKAVDKLSKTSEQGVFQFVCDLQKPDNILEMAKWAEQTFNKVDGLLLNAGGPPAGGAQAFDDAAWEKALEITFMSVVRLTRAIIPLMRKQKFGRIVAIESSSVKQSLANLALSNAVRPAAVAYLKSLSEEVAAENILINTLLPGPIRTERLENLLQAWAKQSGTSVAEVTQKRVSKIPVGRFGQPQELADIATFLFSGKNTYITGQSIAVDGGFSKTVF